MILDNDKVPTIGVDCVEEHEDGSATYTFHMDDYTRGKMAYLGVEFILTCAAYNLDTADALEYLGTYCKTIKETSNA